MKIRLLITQLVPGMIVAEDVLTLDNQLVLTKGTILSDKLITKLHMYSIYSIYVQRKPSLVVEISTLTDRVPSYAERLKSTPEYKHFKQEYEISIDALQTTINKVVTKNSKLDVGELLHTSLQQLTEAAGNRSIMDMLQNMREYDDSTYAHCLNSALLCNIFAGWLKFSPGDTELATACGLLHDIGKLMIPHDIIAKPAKLTEKEYRQIKTHPVSGYQILRSAGVNEHIYYSALMHHERNDGSGYPMNLRGNQIDKFAKMVSIVDVYDAMTAARVYREAMCPFKVIEIFEQEGFEKYDVEYLLIFLTNVVNTYLQNECLLSDGRIATIVMINKDKLSRPMVKCNSQFIDLTEHPELHIEKIV